MEAIGALVDVKSYSKKLLELEYDSETSIDIINELYNYFKETTQISIHDGEIKDAVSIPASKGMALSIKHAAECFLDYKRTTQFLKGLVRAIKDKQQEFPNTTIHIFYAGCGPYAPFFTLVAPLFTPKEVQFTLLEINKDSLEKAEFLIESLSLKDYVKTSYLSDATIFKVENPKSYHILFSETLDALLYRECYVPILWNLLPQFSEEIAVVPENVKIDLYFKRENELVFEKTLFDVRERVEKSKMFNLFPHQFKTVKVDLSKAVDYHKMYFATQVNVYKNLKLLCNDSSISRGLEMEIQKPIVHKAVNFTYYTKPKMELKLALEN